jgi:hypothetical protein
LTKNIRQTIFRPVIKTGVLFFIYCIFIAAAGAQPNAYADSLLLGSWKYRGPDNLPGATIALIRHSDGSPIQVTPEGGVWKYIPDSGIWRCLNPEFQIPDPVDATLTDSGMVICTKNRGCFILSDSSKKLSMGLSWLQIYGNPIQIQGVGSTVLMLARDRLIPGGKIHTVLYSSDDGGATFSRINAYDPDIYGPDSYFDLAQPRGTNQIFLLFRDSVAVYDPGISQLQLLGRIPIFMFGQTSLSGALYGDSLRMFAQIANYTYISDHTARNWQQIGFNPILPSKPKLFKVHPTDSMCFYFANRYLYRSCDRGNTSTALNSTTGFSYNKDSLPMGISAIAALSDSTFSIGHHLGVHSLHIDAHYSKYLSALLPNSSATDVYIKEDSLYVLTQNFGLYPVRERLATERISSIQGQKLAVGDSLLWAVNDTSVEVFDTKGKSIQFITKRAHGIAGLIRNAIPVATQGNELWIGGGFRPAHQSFGSYIMVCKLQGDSISIEEDVFNFDKYPIIYERLSGLAIPEGTSQNRYAVTNIGNFYYSLNQGLSWVKSPFFRAPDTTDGSRHTLFVSPVNPNVIYVAGSAKRGAPIFVSDNGGRDFRPISEGLGTVDVFDLLGYYDDSLLVALTDKGPFIFQTSLNRWINFSEDSLPILFHPTLARNKSRIAAAFPGAGIWEFELSARPVKDTLIGISTNKHAEISVYPNPFFEELILETPFTESLILHLYTLNGTWLSTGVFPSGLHMRLSRLKGLKAGSYILIGQTQNGEIVLHEKVVKQP